MKICFTLNGQEETLDIRPDRRAIDVLRYDLGCTGTKESCGSGECGACSILVDGEQKLSCLMLAGQLHGRRVVTIEGLEQEKTLHPLQKAFEAKGAVQCGFCTPGMILAAHAFLEKHPSPDKQEIKRAISGNICRCTGYTKIVDAILSASLQSDGESKQ
ncbi:MAG TPA: (2Fe-2S)-binding protein [Desulfobacteria bacterium]|nr:(2Fe-2S)-binding protein [Desulfobacteria bacterium]